MVRRSPRFETARPMRSKIAAAVRPRGRASLQLQQACRRDRRLEDGARLLPSCYAHTPSTDRHSPTACAHQRGRAAAIIAVQPRWGAVAASTSQLEARTAGNCRVRGKWAARRECPRQPDASMAAIVLPPTCRLGALHMSSNLFALTFSRLPLHLVTCYDTRRLARSHCWPAGAREASSFRFARLA